MTEQSKSQQLATQMRYTEDLVHIPGSSFWSPEDIVWRELPAFNASISKGAA